MGKRKERGTCEKHGAQRFWSAVGKRKAQESHGKGSWPAEGWEEGLRIPLVLSEAPQPMPGRDVLGVRNALGVRDAVGSRDALGVRDVLGVWDVLGGQNVLGGRHVLGGRDALAGLLRGHGRAAGGTQRSPRVLPEFCSRC